MFSKQNEQLVAFRDGDLLHQSILITEASFTVTVLAWRSQVLQQAYKKQVDEWKAKVDKQLSVSDQINNGDLLRFYAKSGLKRKSIQITMITKMPYKN